MNYIIGIDTDANGAWCIIDSSENIVYTDNLPIYEQKTTTAKGKVKTSVLIDFWPLFESITNKLTEINPKSMEFFIEKPFIMRHTGNETSMRNFQTCFCSFSFNRKRPNILRPQDWQKALALNNKNMDIKEQAQNFYLKKHNKLPLILAKSKRGKDKINQGKIDAYCIALAGLHLHNIGKDI